MNRPITAYVLAALAIAAMTWLTSALLPILGLASAALLFLLPVLFASVRGGVGPGLLAALAGAVAYNYFLLPPRFTFRIHGLDNIVSFMVLAAVALVTSRLATLLKAREAEAQARAQASREEAELAGLLGKGEQSEAVLRGMEWLEGHYGKLQLLTEGLPSEVDANFTSLDLSAAAWAAHNGDMTGHGTQIMPAADWTFLPLTRRIGQECDIIALSSPATGETRSESELSHLQQLASLLGQAKDRSAFEHERRERQHLEETDRLRRALLASLAHDFRTPLTVIVGRLEALAANIPEAGDALIAARRLDRMMQDLIGAARLEDGSLKPNIESVDLVDAVSAAIDETTPPSAVLVERTIQADLPFVRADPVLLHHVLLNLLGNAMRHARTRVLLDAHDTGGSVVLAVHDDGPGIPASEREWVFERFTRVEGSDRKNGSGLGLAIVKGFAEAMGMTASVSESPLGGACFSLSFPYAEVPAT